MTALRHSLRVGGEEKQSNGAIFLQEMATCTSDGGGHTCNPPATRLFINRHHHVYATMYAGSQDPSPPQPYR
jgi:hypothetical protein